MSRRLERWRSRSRGDRTQLLVCRGGDCGSRRKHPEVDHAGQLARCRERLAGSVDVRATKCLDACEFSNVFVVVPSGSARAAGIASAWFGRVLDLTTTDAVSDQARGDVLDDQGADVLRAHRFVPSIRSRSHVLA